jgi:hypothetical protein
MMPDDTIEIVDANGSFIATTYRTNWGSDSRGDMDAANARLIAAAPDLLSALREMVRAWDASGLSVTARLDHALSDADAAITKAERAEAADARQSEA